jgi:hypothetical protein
MSAIALSALTLPGWGRWADRRSSCGDTRFLRQSSEREGAALSSLHQPIEADPLAFLRRVARAGRAGTGIEHLLQDTPVLGVNPLQERLHLDLLTREVKQFIERAVYPYCVSRADAPENGRGIRLGSHALLLGDASYEGD